MKSQTIRLLLAAFAFTAALTGCDSFKREATEGDAMLGVAVQGKIKESAKPLLAQIFSDVVYTPQAESRFVLKYVGEDSLGYVSHWPNVLLLGTLESDDPVSQRIQRMLDDEAEQGVRSGDLRVFRQRNMWVRGQTVVVAVAPTLDDLLGWLRTDGEVIDDLLSEDRYERMKKEIYARLEQEEMADSLREAHGWQLRIPHDYLLVSSSRDPNYIRLRRPYPDRFITVAWKSGTPDSVTADNLVSWRNRLGLTYPDSSRTNTAILDTNWTNLGGQQALEVHGIWETYGPLGGGPYIAYLLHKDGTLYLLDGKVFAPDRLKEPYIRHLEVIFSTFQP